MLEFVVEKLVGLLPLLQTKAAQRRDLQDNALRSIAHALTETSLYQLLSPKIKLIRSKTPETD